MKVWFWAGKNMVFLSPSCSRDLITLNRDKSEAAEAGVAHFGFRLVDRAEMDVGIKEVERAGGKLLSQGKGGNRSFPTPMLQILTVTSSNWKRRQPRVQLNLFAQQVLLREREEHNPPSRSNLASAQT